MVVDGDGLFGRGSTILNIVVVDRFVWRGSKIRIIVVVDVLGSLWRGFTISFRSAITCRLNSGCSDRILSVEALVLVFLGEFGLVRESIVEIKSSDWRLVCC